MRAVHVGIGHDDDAVVAGLGGVEGGLILARADAGADGGDEGADFLVVEHLDRKSTRLNSSHRP